MCHQADALCRLPSLLEGEQMRRTKRHRSAMTNSDRPQGRRQLSHAAAAGPPDEVPPTDGTRFELVSPLPSSTVPRTSWDQQTFPNVADGCDIMLSAVSR